jgi:LysR family carnitine catabolism transcriptional activator
MINQFYKLLIMDLRRLEVFLAVVDDGTFTGAADVLGVSQPAVSQSIRALEAELGTPLFHRLGREVRLTDAGTALCEPARLARRDVEVARAAVQSVRGLLSGRLELACLPTLAASPLAALVGDFRRRHEAVSVLLLDPDDIDDVLELVRSGTCELGIVADCDVGVLCAIPLEAQEFYAILPPGNTPRDAIAVEELADMPMVAPPVGSSSRKLLDDVLARTGRTPRVVVETAQREALLPLVLAGAGAALVPSVLAEVGRAIGCVICRVQPSIGRDVLLVYRDAVLSPAAAAFVALAREGQAR